ncbi:shikimate kinase I [Agrilactobacillus composti DSM 18527 = JCM 14202]|uniref:shikimate kinase n=1 Tax=Agrilactobacillus composti TaxID=398555 RepID=UPI00042E075D|nr:shikimate kinase [Agrilactobacillus composti]GAF40730.1 shikimate kinase I [Agrilactobacillus composti DSM 18527 = JCM 14202]
MMARLVLVGFMGAGKTTVGQLLAQNTGFRFTDLDQAIVEIAGRPIPDIFAAEGEAGFRRRETEALAQALDQDVIVSTGGGIVTQAQNRALLKAAGAGGVLKS